MLINKTYINNRLIEEIYIRNDGTGSHDVGSYDVTFLDHVPRRCTYARVEGWPRANHPNRLVEEAYKAARTNPGKASYYSDGITDEIRLRIIK